MDVSSAQYLNTTSQSSTVLSTIPSIAPETKRDACTGSGHYNTSPGSGVAAHGSRLAGDGSRPSDRGFFFGLYSDLFSRNKNKIFGQNSRNRCNRVTLG